MRILVLAPHPFFQDRGTPIAVKLLVRVLAGAGHTVDILTFHEGEDVEIPGARVQRIPALPGVRNIRPGFSVKKLACDFILAMEGLSLLRQRRHDLVHAVEESAFIAAVAKKLFRVPFLYDMDSSLPKQMMDKYAWLRSVRRILFAAERFAVRESLGVVAVCRALEEEVRAYDPDKPVLRLEDISLLDPEADMRKRPEIDAEQRPEAAAGPLPEGATETRPEARVDVQRPYAMYVGNLESYQGIDLLLEGFRHLHQRRSPGNLVVIGGDEQGITRYRARARELGIAERVFFLGVRPVSDLGLYVTQANVLVSPRTQGENTPMKIYSYLDSGRPIVATRLPTHTQVLDDDIASLVPPDAGAMGEALAQLFQDPELADELGRKGKERAQQEYTFEAFRRKLLAFYGEAETTIRQGESGVRS
jgi:glycosyltransferase involved in cell wall biosynthesis